MATREHSPRARDGRAQLHEACREPVLMAEDGVRDVPDITAGANSGSLRLPTLSDISWHVLPHGLRALGHQFMEAVTQ